MLNQYAGDNPTLPVNLCFSHLFIILVAVLWECRAATMGHQVFLTRVVYRETFLQIQRRLLQHLICKSHIHGVLIYQNQFTHHRQNRVRNQTPVQEQRCQSGPSAGNSVVLSEGKFSKNYGQTNNDCRFGILILTNSPRQQRSLVGSEDSRLRYVLAHNFIPKPCRGSKKWRWLIQWMI